MADADEDFIPRSHPFANGSSSDPTYDIEDEAQDFRFLASLSGTNTNIPKRGEKDFEPNPTRAQQSILEASREAMHDALSVERVHPAKNACVGVYLSKPCDWWYDMASDKSGSGARCVVVEKFRGPHNKTLGKEDFRNWTWLLPEEALFLIERGSLDIRWPDDSNMEMITKMAATTDHDDDNNDENENENENENDLDRKSPHAQDHVTSKTSKPSGAEEQDGSKSSRITAKKVKFRYTLRVGELPMSLQGAYACLIGKSGLTLERYTVYSGLKRLGYVVSRAPTWDVNDEDNSNNVDTLSISSETSQASSSPKNTQVTKYTPTPPFISRLLLWLYNFDKPKQQNPSHGPLVRPGLYRNYNDIFRALTLIPSTTSAPSYSSTSTTIKPKPPFNIHYSVIKPSISTYRKSSPPSPDFSICVLNARTTSLPTLTEISTLLDSTSEDVLPRDKRTEMRLKHGRRNVLLAVVDCGVVSYLRVSDMASGELGRVHEEKVRRNIKTDGFRGRGGHRGGGRGGQGGRGRGR